MSAVVPVSERGGPQSAESGLVRMHNVVEKADVQKEKYDSIFIDFSFSQALLTCYSY